MKNMEKTVAENLLQIKAIKLEPANPFLWASGWYSPIYCDNRLILSFPKTRKLVTDGFCRLIRLNYPDVTLIAGVATGAIAHGALVAGELDLPFAYVRPSPKAHGLAKMIEGLISENDRVVVIEDLVSTGKSSLYALDVLRSAGCNVMGMVAIFTYGFDKAVESFRNSSCRLDTLTSYHVLAAVAEEMGLITDQQLETLKQWREDPASWGSG